MRPRQSSLAWAFLAASTILAGSETAVLADAGQGHETGMPTHAMCDPSRPSMSSGSEFEGVQLETSDIGLYERFFSEVLHAEELQRIDHPQVDHVRGYCFRHVIIVVRQDIKTPRPTGWMQVNFSVADVGDVQKQLEHSLRESNLATLDEVERARIVRLRFKSDVPRSNCRVDRLEVSGPEGFMIGFNQFMEGTCKSSDQPMQKDNPEHNRPHH
jgi:hypothetical protein